MRRFGYFLAAGMLTIFAGCKKDEISKSGKYTAAEVSIGHGVAYSWVDVDERARPKCIGITMTRGAFDHLPDSAATHGHPLDYVLALPAEGFRTPFNHIAITWNPVGHFPPPYAFSHFDFHWYMMGSAERLAIPTYTADSLKFKHEPAPHYLPPNYVRAPGGEPKMGAHWVDINSPELLPPPNNKAFTETFIYGSYNGRVTFLEPMVTRAFCLSVSSYERPIPWPQKVQLNGYYPKKMRMLNDDDGFHLFFEDFEYRTAEY